MRHYLIASIVFIILFFLSLFLIEYSSKHLYVMSVSIFLLGVVNFFFKKPNSPTLKIRISDYFVLIESYRVFFVGTILILCGIIIFIIDQKNPLAALFTSLSIFFMSLGRISLEKDSQHSKTNRSFFPPTSLRPSVLQ